MATSVRSLAIVLVAASVWTALVFGQGQAPQQPGRQGGAAAPQQPMSFFITSVGIGRGGDLGGLAGADAHCQALATAAGRGNVTWRAYLSTQGTNAVNARDRIGRGPWYGATGQIIARDVAHLHGDTLELARMGNGLHQLHATNEKGEIIQGRVGGTPDRPSIHDILTGTQADGTAYPAGMDQTCSNWTSSAEGIGSARLGHFDRVGADNNSWNSTHATRGCSQANVSRGGGAGLFYCFAAN
jgi:hypothetical protein